MVMALILLPSVGAFVHAQQQGASSEHAYQLKPTPKTVEWGYYDPKTPPVLRIKSGDTVEIQTLLASNPERFASAGIADDHNSPTATLGCGIRRSRSGKTAARRSVRLHALSV